MNARIRQNEALALRTQGYSFPAIAALLGYSAPQSARNAVLAAARRAGITAPTAPTATVTDSTDRKFGIEIEFTGLSAQGALTAVRAAGLTCEIEGYNHNTRSHWKIVSDSTCGYELVSPPLAGDAGFAAVTTAMNALDAAGAKVNRNCGLHVHHDSEGLSGSEIAAFVEFYVKRQDSMDRLVAPSRRRGGNTWCKRVGRNELADIISSFTQDRRPPARFGQGESSFRYRTINVMSMLRHGTIEIRQHQGSLNPEKAIAWIKFGQAMIRSAQAGATNAVPNTVFEMLQTLTTDHGLDAQDAEFLMGRAMHFTAAQ